MFNHMDYVYAVYQEKSFTRAAASLYISQPALSSVIRKLEQELGYPIFERSGREITPTYLGEKYIRAAEQVMEIRKSLINEADDYLQLRKGSIILGSTTFIVSCVLPDILKKFQAAFPGIEVQILVEQSTVLKEKLEKGLVDLAIDNITSLNPDYAHIPLFGEHILLGVPREMAVNRLLTEKQISPDMIKDSCCDYSKLPKVNISDFQKEDFILLKSGNQMRQTADGIFSEQGITPHIRFEFDQLMTSVSFAQKGFGICFLTDTILKYGGEYRNMVFYQPDTQSADRTLYVMYKENRYLSSASGEMVRSLQSALSK